MSKPEGFWTKEKTKTLVELFKLDRTGQEIASVVGTTRSAVSGKLARMGLKKGRNPPRPKVPKRRNRPMTAREKVLRRAQKPEPILMRGNQIPPLLNSIAERKFGQCPYPYGDRNFKFCGRPVERGAFCEAHAQLCYQPRKVAA